MVDFTADWCPNCKFNERTAIETQAVKKMLEENGVVSLKADWTDHSRVIKQVLAGFGK